MRDPRRGETWLGRLAVQEQECVQWLVGGEVSVQGSHVSVPGRGRGPKATDMWGPHLKEAERVRSPAG